MSSPRRVRASRANGRKSRGPVTPEGKQRSSLNAITHGLTASSVVLGAESAERFQLLLEACVETVRPASLLEYTCAEEMAFAKWQFRRAIGVETSLIGLEMDRMVPELDREFESVPHPLRVALACQRLHEKSTFASNLQRYQSRLVWRFERAVKELRALRELNPGPSPHPLPATEPEPAETGGRPAASAAGNNEPDPSDGHEQSAPAKSSAKDAPPAGSPESSPGRPPAVIHSTTSSAGKNEPNPTSGHPQSASQPAGPEAPGATRTSSPPPAKTQPKTYYAVMSEEDYARITGRRPR